MNVDRREFLGAVAGALAAPAAARAAAGEIPRRAFGKTGLTVSAIGFGSGSRFLMYEREDQALAALERAIDLGITYIDTAHSYGNGKSEERIGKVMARRRNEVTLATKLSARKKDEARKQIELSLKRLQTDRLDVVHIHALKDMEDLKAAEGKDGVLQALYEARDQKIVRAIGVSCHASPEALKAALERHDFDATQMALNAALARMADNPGGMKATLMRKGGFEELALPVATRKNLGIIAMKVFGQDQLVGAASIEKMLTYSMSLPVSLCSLGMPKPEFIEKNVAIAKAFRPMSAEERRKLSDSIAEERKVAMRSFFADHADV